MGLKQFNKVKLLGQGTSGMVFLATKKQKYRANKEPINFAIKIQKIKAAPDTDMFTEPAMLMQMSRCPRIIRCFFAGISLSSLLYICMDYCPYTLTTFLEIPKNAKN